MSERVISALAVDFLVLGRRVADGELAPPDARGFRAQLLKELSAFETEAKRRGASSQDLEDAKYAIAAFLDEMVLSSDWEGQTEWSMAPLMPDRHAGERFFQRLRKVRDRSVDVLGLYYDCLVMGYEGMYGVSQDRNSLQSLIEHLKKDLSDSALESAPVSVPADFRAPSPPKPWAWLGVLLLVLSLVSWGVMKTTLESDAETAVDKINRTGG